MEHGRDRELAASALRRYYNFAGLLVKSVVSSYKKILSFGCLSKGTTGLGIRLIIYYSRVDDE